MGKSISMLLAKTGLAIMAVTTTALAGNPISVLVDRSQLMQLTTDPGTVVVGNPSIADVSLNGRQLFIHGRSAGETNLMVFDQSGDKIADFDISIMQVGENAITVFKGSPGVGVSRYSYVCAPICEHTMIAGDEHQPLSNIITDNQTKFGFAQGVKPSTTGPTAAAPAQ